MFQRLKEFLEIWPTVDQALTKKARCVKTGHHHYVVKDKSGQAEAQQRETDRLCPQSDEHPEYEKIRLTIARELAADTTPYPKLLSFGTTGRVIVMALNYDVNIADMMDL